MRKEEIVVEVGNRISEVGKMLDYANLALRVPTEEDTVVSLREAKAWLKTLDKQYERFTQCYTQPHTGEVFWENIRHTGVPKGQIFSDNLAAIEMRGILHQVHMKYNRRPEIFGGTVKKAKKPRKGHSKANHSGSEDKGVVSP